MALTDRAIMNLKAIGKPHKHFDGGGLHIHVSPTGGKLWRLSYRFNGKPKTLSLGAYPTITLKMARDRRGEAKNLLANDIDPNTHKRELKQAARTEAANTFEAIGIEWYAKNKSKWVEKTARIIKSCLENNVYPAIGKLSIRTIKAPELSLPPRNSPWYMNMHLKKLAHLRTCTVTRR